MYRISDKPSEQSANSENVASDSKGNSVVFDFDQVDRHRKFWDFLRAKEWQAVATFLEKKVLHYLRTCVAKIYFVSLLLLGGPKQAALNTYWFACCTFNVFSSYLIIVRMNVYHTIGGGLQ